MTQEEAAIADALLRQAGCEPVGSDLLGPFSNRLPDAFAGKSSYFLAMLMDAEAKMKATDEHVRRSQADAGWYAPLGGPTVIGSYIDEVEPPVNEKVQYRHKEYAYSYQYLKELDDPPAPRKRTWRERLRLWWAGVRIALVDWIDPR